MYHNVHLWTTPLEGQFPRTNRKGAVEESLLWLDFQSLPKALMSIAHVYPLHNVIRMRRQRSSRKACYGWTLIRSLPPLVVCCVDRSYNQPPPAHLGPLPVWDKTSRPYKSSPFIFKSARHEVSNICEGEKYPKSSLFPQFSSGSCHYSQVYMNGQW